MMRSLKQEWVEMRENALKAGQGPLRQRDYIMFLNGALAALSIMNRTSQTLSDEAMEALSKTNPILTTQ